MSNKLKEHSFFEKVMSGAVVLVFLIWLYFPVKNYWIESKEEEAIYQRIKSNSRHIKIDDLPNDIGVYMIIYKGDTLGVVAIKN